METFIARQPIFDRNQKIYGYELLFRKSSNSKIAELNDETATAEVLVNSYLHFGFDELTNNTFSFINFTEKLLLDSIPENFPPSQLVIEILENVSLDEKIINACKRYKQMGYTIALDDFEFNENNRNILQILPLIDIIKVDFRTTSKQKRTKILKLKKYFPIYLLAEKVETVEEYNEALQEGFDFFQGYFFQKPVIFSKRDVPGFFHNYINLLHEVKKPEPNIDHLTTVIESDLSLSYNLLKLINKNYIKDNKISSIKQAIVILGLNEFQRWIYILSLRDTSKMMNPTTIDLIRMSLVRSKFCELFATKSLHITNSSPYFLGGMFSLIDTILHVPMEKVLQDLPLDKDISNALLGTDNTLRKVLDMAIAVEQADWQKMNECINLFLVKDHDIFSIYYDAIRWANLLLNSEQFA